MPDDLMRLAERCEAATGPDPQIDVDILSAAVWEGQGHKPPLLPYTASIDAAMTLVPEGKFVNLDGPRKYLNIPTPVPNHWRARIGYAPEHRGWAATPALALCAAALKAAAALRAKEQK